MTQWYLQRFCVWEHLLQTASSDSDVHGSNLSRTKMTSVVLNKNTHHILFLYQSKNTVEPILHVSMLLLFFYYLTGTKTHICSSQTRNLFSVTTRVINLITTFRSVFRLEKNVFRPMVVFVFLSSMNRIAGTRHEKNIYSKNVLCTQLMCCTLL